MSYFITDIKKLYKNKLTITMLVALALVMVADPISVYLQYGRDEHFINSIGQNGFQFWLLMNSRSWGFTVYHSLLMAFPVLSTGLVFFEERSSSMYEWLITRDGKKKYYLAKILSVFIITFVNFFILFSINVLVTSFIFPFDAIQTEAFANYVPQVGMFSYPFYEQGLLSMVFLFVFLNSLTLALLALLALSCHMMVLFKSRYMAILFPFIGLYAITYLISILLSSEYWNYNFKVIIQPMVGALSKTIITTTNVMGVYGALTVLVILLLVASYVKNGETL